MGYVHCFLVTNRDLGMNNHLRLSRCTTWDLDKKNKLATKHSTWALESTYNFKGKKKPENQFFRGSPPSVCDCGAASLVTYLKDFLIKYPGSEHHDSSGVDDGVSAPEQPLGGPLFTVQNEGDGLPVHADGHSVPPGKEGAVCSRPYWITRLKANSSFAVFFFFFLVFKHVPG